MDWLVRLFGDGESFRTVLGAKHRVASRLQKFGSKLSDSLFVFHNQHRLAPPNRSDRNFFTLGRLRSLVDSWELDFESRPFLRPRLHPNPPAPLLHDPL